MIKEKENAFTLVEMLTAVIILGLISIIIVPTVERATNRAREELYKIQINNIRDGAKNWGAKNFILLPESEGEIITLTLGQLKVGGFVDNDIKNPRSRKYFPNDMEIVITNVFNDYEYKVVEGSGGLDNEINYDLPSIVLKGLIHEIVEVDKENPDAYEDEGVIATDPSGSILEGVTSIITSNGVEMEEITINELRQYKITYSVVYHGKTAKIIRTVTIKDTTPPVIQIEGDVDLTIPIGEINGNTFLEGITVTDNYDGNIDSSKIEKVGDVSAWPGVYYLKYTVSDSSGNSSSITRKITVTED